ncbi:hypothetical protein RhiirB3_524960 [Rhizophagus irregularis]|nr:hypothetical protein RhiirB3_524960 [Rhizophagus irregularis]
MIILDLHQITILKVSCNDINYVSNRNYWVENWKFNHVEFLRSHDIQFTIGNDTFQEVVCHNERLGGNDEWCIELIKQHVWTIDD